MAHRHDVHLRLRHLFIGLLIAAGTTALLPPGGARSASPTYTFLRAFGQDSLTAPVGIAIDGAGSAYVNDQTMNVVQKFDATTGALQSTFQRGQLASGSRLVAIDASNNLYVADYNNFRVQVFDASSGQVVRSIAGANLSGPEDVLLVSGQLYVSDFDGSQVETFTTSGAYVGQFGSGSLGEPVGIAADHAGNLLLVNNYYDSVSLFDASHHFVRQFGNSGPGALNRPRGVSVDPSTGNILVSDTGNNRIVIFDPQGNFLGALDGISGKNTTELNAPFGLAFDSAGNLYVVDSGNHRVDVFGDAPTPSPTTSSTLTATSTPALTATPTPTISLSGTPTATPTVSGTSTVTATPTEPATTADTPTATPRRLHRFRHRP